MLRTDLNEKEVAILRYLDVPVTHVKNCDCIKDRTENEIDVAAAEAKLEEFQGTVINLNKRIKKAGRQTA